MLVSYRILVDYLSFAFWVFVYDARGSDKRVFRVLEDVIVRSFLIVYFCCILRCVCLFCMYVVNMYVIKLGNMLEEV